MKNKNAMRSLTLTIVCVFLGAIIALQLKSINSSSNIAMAENLRVEELSQELMDLMKKNGELADKIDELQSALRLTDSQSESDEAQLRRITTERDNAEVFAGLTDVMGPGGTITLTPAKNFEVEDTELRTIVNALRASGAQAISINDQRLIATSEMINAGTMYVMINGQRFLRSGQFEIKVIIDPADFENAKVNLSTVFMYYQNNYMIDIVALSMPSVNIRKLAVDSPAYRMDLLKPAQ